MKNSNHYESALWKVLEKEGLADLSHFHKPGFFEEVPLYSRLSDISFLSKLSSDEASAILLGFSLKFLKAVISYEDHRIPYFAAITVWDLSEGDPIVPNIFVWSGDIRKLYGQMTLVEAKTRFGRGIRQLVTQLRLSDGFQILEDASTTQELSRVFIGPSLPPYRGFVPPYTFIKAVSATS